MNDATLREHRSRVAGALDYIQDNLAGDLSLDRLAGRAGVSPYHFHRLFKAMVGEPPKKYVRRLRLEHAAVRLKHTNRSVTGVAFEAGYETHEAFTRAFKSRFGASPRRFRSRAGGSGRASLRARIVELPSQQIAYVRHVGPYDQASGAFDRLIAWAAQRGLLDEASVLGVYWDDQSITAPRHTRCDAALSVEAGVASEGDIRVRALPGGDYAVVRHEGRYQAQALRRIYELVYGSWLPAIGREPADAPPFEVYRTPSQGPEFPSLVTSVHVPLAAKRA